jgi:hypothetical protein
LTVDELEVLLAEAEIGRVTARYCRGIDRMDEALVRSCYHPGATDEHGSFSGDVDGYVAWVWGLLERYRSTMHLIANQLVELDRADSARVETYGIAVHRGTTDEPSRNLTTGFRFVDRFDRIDGRWAVTRRVAVTEWSQVVDPSAWWELPATLRVGRRDRDDPAYWV